jgi:hypothetical protein|tara:strand:- start:2535 stop:2699 length:165 start_codon:yes stop_codon:yes gene_type:complete
MIDQSFSKPGRDRRDSYRIYQKQTQAILDALESGEINEEEARRRFKKLKPFGNV